MTASLLFTESRAQRSLLILNLQGEFAAGHPVILAHGAPRRSVHQGEVNPFAVDAAMSRFVFASEELTEIDLCNRLPMRIPRDYDTVKSRENLGF